MPRQCVHVFLDAIVSEFFFCFPSLVRSKFIRFPQIVSLYFCRVFSSSFLFGLLLCWVVLIGWHNVKFGFPMFYQILIIAFHHKCLCSILNQLSWYFMVLVNLEFPTQWKPYLINTSFCLSGCSLHLGSPHFFAPGSLTGN